MIDTSTIRPHCPLGSRWEIETLKHEVIRLQQLMREPLLPADERLIAEAQLQDYLELLTAEELN